MKTLEPGDPVAYRLDETIRFGILTEIVIRKTALEESTEWTVQSDTPDGRQKATIHHEENLISPTDYDHYLVSFMREHQACKHHQELATRLVDRPAAQVHETAVKTTAVTSAASERPPSPDEF